MSFDVSLLIQNVLMFLLSFFESRENVSSKWNLRRGNGLESRALWKVGRGQRQREVVALVWSM